VRLQEEILKDSDDESIFAWAFDSSPFSEGGRYAFIYQLFASSPADFASCMDLMPYIPAGVRPSHYTLTNKGLHIEADVWTSPLDSRLVFARLNCAPHGREGSSMSLALPLLRSKDNDMLFFRLWGPPVLVSSNLFSDTLAHIYLHRSINEPLARSGSGLEIKLSFKQDCRQPGRYNLAQKIKEFYPVTWSGLMTNGIISHPQLNVDFEHQNILFSIETEENRENRPNYVVRLEYWYSTLHAYHLVPKKLKCRASILQRGKSLAEVIMQSRGAIETALDWQEALVLGDSKLTFRVDDSDAWEWPLHIEVVAK
jgi:hypothetical protein